MSEAREHSRDRRTPTQVCPDASACTMTKMSPRSVAFGVFGVLLGAGCGSTADAPSTPDGGGDAAPDQTSPFDASDAEIRDVAAPDTGPVGDPSDPGPGPCTDAPPDVSLSLVATTNAGKVYKAAYKVAGSERLAQVCVPSSAGPHPIFVVNHGGFVGLQNELTDRTYCNIGLAKGYVTVEAQYRGESDTGFGASAGSIEFCNGEATDVIELLKIARRRCDVDPKRVAALGISHGGCVTLQLASRNVALRALVDIVGPTRAAPLYEYHAANRTTGSAAEQKAHNELADNIPLWVGGTPTTVPQAYDDRSPALRAKNFVKTPIMIVHGTADYVVPHAQSCELREALISAGASFVNLHVNTSLGLVTDQVPSCAQAAYASGLPASYPGDHYFIVFDGQGHAIEGLAATATLNTVNLFLDAHI